MANSVEKIGAEDSGQKIPAKRAVTVSTFHRAKVTGRKLKMLTAYDHPTAKLLDDSGVDALLVGDSLGMVVLGYEDTTRVTMEDMIHHTKAVVRGTTHAMVIADLPFATYNTAEKAVENGARLMRAAGAKAVKLEGGLEVVPQVKAMLQAGIPVMGHMGYTPQSVNVFGGHKSQGRSLDKARNLVRSALELQEAGVFGIVLELVPFRVAEFISQHLSVPTIGIGSGAGCDGQVLVTLDMMGFFPDFNPRHVRRYADLYTTYHDAATQYINEIDAGEFPTNAHSFEAEDGVLEALAKEFA